MKQISFSNFRRFDDLSCMEFGNVNFFVGKNSSGKSSVIKAIILGLENVSRLVDLNMQMGFFSFATDSSAHLNMGDFRANLKDDANSSSMFFSYTLGDVRIDMELDGQKIADGQSSMSVPLRRLKVFHNDLQAGFTYDRKNAGSFDVSFKCERSNVESFVQDRIDRKNKLNNLVQPIAPLAAPFFNYHPRNKWEAVLDDLKQKDEQIIVSWKEKVNISNAQNHSASEVADKKHLELHDYILHAKRTIRDACKKELRSYCYIEAHNASHNELLYIEDKNNYLAQTIVAYDRAGIIEGDEEYKFIIRWLHELEVLDEDEYFKIQQPYGEAYRVVIAKDGKPEGKSIGSLGTGSIQMFILLLRIAIMMKKGGGVTAFIEEPEQNLHPALQSKLAHLFTEVAGKSGIRLVVETHSEYLIRSMQLVVAQQVANDNKNIRIVNREYKVYYFPKDNLPYSMEFDYNGHFLKKFGSGFFDEAGNSYLALISPYL